MGVNPASIGHHSRQYQSSQSAAMDSTSEGRVAQLLEWRRSVYDDILERKGWGCLQTIDDLPREEDARARAERHQIEIRSGLRTINETRKEDGIEPSTAEGTEVLLVGGGLVPLEQVVKPPAGGDGDDEPDPPAPGKGPVDEASPESKDDSGDKQASAEASESDPTQNVERALKQWERKSLNRLARGKSASCGFVCADIETSVLHAISERLEVCKDKLDVFAVFHEADEVVRSRGRKRLRARTTNNPHNTPGSFAPDEGKGSSGSIGNGTSKFDSPADDDDAFNGRYVWHGDKVPKESKEFQDGKAAADEAIFPFTAPEKNAEAGVAVCVDDGSLFNDKIVIGEPGRVTIPAPRWRLYAAFHSHDLEETFSIEDWETFLNHPFCIQSHALTPSSIYSVHKPLGWVSPGYTIDQIKVDVLEATWQAAEEMIAAGENLNIEMMCSGAVRKLAEKYGILYRVGVRKPA